MQPVSPMAMSLGKRWVEKSIAADSTALPSETGTAAPGSTLKYARQVMGQGLPLPQALADRPTGAPLT
jgi:hypothetical protein